MDQKQLDYRVQQVIGRMNGLALDAQKLVLQSAYAKLFPGETIQSIQGASKVGSAPTTPSASGAASDERERLFWEGLDKNLKLGDPVSLKLYNEIREQQEAREITRDIQIFIEHDEIPDRVLRTALEGTGIDIASTCEGIEEAASVPYTPPG